MVYPNQSDFKYPLRPFRPGTFQTITSPSSVCTCSRNFTTHKHDLDDLPHFLLMVRKNYRKMPYCNWSHGFAIANQMYIMKTRQNRLTPVECRSRHVACLYYGLCHQSKTNKCMVQIASKLAIIYTTSSLEYHHFNQTVTIQQNAGHNIFKYLTLNRYKMVF